MKLKLLSRVRLLATPWTAAHQAPQDRKLQDNPMVREQFIHIEWLMAFTEIVHQNLKLKLALSVLSSVETGTAASTVVDGMNSLLSVLPDEQY